MWNYEKRLEYPINIKETNPKIAKYIMSQYGGLYCNSISPVNHLFHKNEMRPPHQILSTGTAFAFILFPKNVSPKDGRSLLHQ